MTPFPWTLQRYIFREMGKTFLLTSIALTGMFGLGGGVLNMVRLGEVTPAQLWRMMALLLPLAAGLTLPIAALFSAAATYGRLSADNEFVACRGSGINMYILFAPTVMLSLLGACLTFGLSNYVIPGMVRGLDQLVTADVGSLIRQRLNRPRGIRLGGKYRIHADECVTDPARPNEVSLVGVAFVEVDNDEWVRFGTAKEVRLHFDRDESHLRVAGWMSGLSYYDRKVGQFVEEAGQYIEPNEVLSAVPQKAKFLNLNELLHYLANPHEWHETRRHLDRLRMAIGQQMVYDDVWEHWNAGASLRFTDGRKRFTLSAKQAGRIPMHGGVELFDVSIVETQEGRTRLITAQRAILEVTRGESLAHSGLRIELRNARLSDGTATIERAKEVLGPVAINEEIVARVEALTVEDLLRSDGLKEDGVLIDVRKRAAGSMGATYRHVIGTISERLAFSLSIFVLVILAAVLGIVFRGSHVMTAFGISFVPLLFVLLMIVTGKQMSHNAGTHLLGLTMIWSGLLVVGGLDIWTLTRVLRR